MPPCLSAEYEVDDRTSLRLVAPADAPPLFDAIDRSRENMRIWLPWVDRARTVQDTAAFEELGLDRVKVWVSQDNARSRAVPERLGFALKGPIPAPGHAQGLDMEFVGYVLRRQQAAPAGGIRP